MQSHYELILSDNGYTFKTEHGQIYELSFLLYPTVNENPDFTLFIFGFEPLTPQKYAYNHRVELTIRFAINKFFNENNNALIVVLDSLDGRHFARKKLFEKWYLNSQNNSIHKFDVQCNTDEIDIIASLLVEKNNPYYKAIYDSFFDLARINFYS